MPSTLLLLPPPRQIPPAPGLPPLRDRSLFPTAPPSFSPPLLLCPLRASFPPPTASSTPRLAFFAHPPFPLFHLPPTCTNVNTAASTAGAAAAAAVRNPLPYLQDGAGAGVAGAARREGGRAAGWLRSAIVASLPRRPSGSRRAARGRPFPAWRGRRELRQLLLTQAGWAGPGLGATEEEGRLRGRRWGSFTGGRRRWVGGSSSLRKKQQPPLSLHLAGGCEPSKNVGGGPGMHALLCCGKGGGGLFECIGKGCVGWQAATNTTAAPPPPRPAWAFKGSFAYRNSAREAFRGRTSRGKEFRVFHSRQT